MDIKTAKELQGMVTSIATDLSDPQAWREDYVDQHDPREDVEFDEVGAHEWLEDVLDIRYIVGRDKQFISAQVLVSFGGPNIWVNFDSKEVVGYWGGEKAIAAFRDTMNIEDYLEELYDCM